MVNTLAVIPARSGSEGVPGKNVRDCAGKPLLVWSVEAALASKHVNRVVVSTDSEDYARIAERAGAEAMIRPADISGPFARIEDALIHTMDKVLAPRLTGEYDPHNVKYGGAYIPELVVTLQPTCPVRRPGLIDECVELLVGWARLNSVTTGYRAGIVYHRVEDLLSPAVEWWSQFGQREIPQRQQWHTNDVYLVGDGSVFVTRREALLKQKNRRARPLWLVENERTVDVDTEADLLMADMMLREQSRREVA